MGVQNPSATPTLMQTEPPTNAIPSMQQQQQIQQKVQIVRSSDGKIQVRGLFPGQQLVQMPDGKLQIFSQATTVQQQKPQQNQLQPVQQQQMQQVQQVQRVQEVQQVQKVQQPQQVQQQPVLFRFSQPATVQQQQPQQNQLQPVQQPQVQQVQQVQQPQQVQQQPVTLQTPVQNQPSQSIIVHPSGSTSTNTMTTSMLARDSMSLMLGLHQALRFANVKLETEVASTQNALAQSKIECAEKTSKIQALKIAKFGLETELASAQKGLEESKVECVEKRSEIQALKIAKIKVETEVTSAQKALEELKEELEKVENQLGIEAASKKSLEALRQDWAIKVYQSDQSNEDLVNLLSLEPGKLFKKYGQIMKFNDSNVVKVEGEIDGTKKDKKLNLQILQRELYEKELDGIMDVLKMPAGDRIYTNILPMIKNLLEQVDTDHYTKAVENLVNE